MIRKSKFLNNLPKEAIIADLIFILINLLLVTQITDIVNANLMLFGLLALPLQILAVSVSIIGFFNKESSQHNRFYKKFWSSFFFNKYAEPLTLGMATWWASITFLSLFGFFWMGPVIKAVITEMNVNPQLSDMLLELLGIAAMLVNFIFMFVALSYTYKLSVNKNLGENKYAKYISAIMVMLFLTFLNAIMRESLIIIKPLVEDGFYTLSIIISVSMFLPVRLVLFLKPPFSIFEVLTFGTAYAIFIKGLLSI